MFIKHLDHRVIACPNHNIIVLYCQNSFFYTVSDTEGYRLVNMNTLCGEGSSYNNLTTFNFIPFFNDI